MRKELPPPQRLTIPARPSLPLPPAPRSHCSDDSLDDRSSVDEAAVQPEQQSPSAERPRGRKEGSVQVAVRVRPLLPREIAASQRACVHHPSADSVELPDADKRFTFDHVFPQSASQSELYDKALQPWLDSFLQGFNVTVIAYGQTGSGKTFTMGNSMPSSEMVVSHLFARASSTETAAAPRTETTADQLKTDDGLIPRFLFQLFDRLNKAGKDEHQVSVSFLEIYGEEIHDLLQRPKQSNDSALDSLQLREGRSGVYVQGLTEVKVGSRVDAMEQMRVGSLRRITGRTEMNEHSSRSHAVYTIKVVRQVSQGGKDSPRRERAAKGILQGAQLKTRRSSTDSGSDSAASSPRGASSRATVVSKLTFVDLAGSERLKKTLAEGNRMKEGIQINVGLLALGNVINALGDDRRRGATHLHIPYRSSKLTRLLQDALGGNSRTLFIACVSPAGSNANETHNTLQYANRAKNIQNKAVKNIDSRSAELLRLKAFNDLLRREFIKASFVGPQETGQDTADARVETIMADPKVQSFLKKLEEIASSNFGRGYSPGSTNQASAEVQRAFASLAFYFPDVARVPRLDIPETLDALGDEVDETPDDPAFPNEDGSFGNTSEESEGGESAVRITPFSLHKLSWALDIITVTLELRGLQHLVASHQDEFASRLFDLDRALHRKYLIRTGLEAALAKMSVKHPEDDRSKEVQRTMKRYAEKISSIDEEVLALERQKADVEGMLAEAVSQCRKDMQSKRERLLKLRQKTVDVFGTTHVSPLDVMIRATELPRRFGIKFLTDATDFLIGEEKAMAAYLDENMMTIAFIASLFPKDEMTSSEAFNLVEEIEVRVQTSLDREDANAMLSHEIRQRAAILQNLAQGWIAGPNENSTELEYLAANQQRLKECDENIDDLKAALKELPSYVESISALVEGISSLPLAKSTLKRLIELLYSQMRLTVALKSEVSADDIEEPSLHQARREELDTDAKELLEQEKKRHDDELKNVMNIVATAMPDSSLNRDQTDQLAHKYATANAKIKELEESKRCYAQKLEKSETEVSKMEQRIRELEESLKANDLKRESIRLMDRCQEIWTELGLSPEETATKFNDINDLLMKKCSEELEGLEAARAAIQARIDDAYRTIELLEAALDVDEPTDLQTLHSVAGKTLLEQEKHLIRRSAELTDEMWLRVDARVAGLSRIQDLVDDMKLEDVAEFRHVPHERLCNIDINKVQAHLVKLQQFRELKNEASSSGLFSKTLAERLVVVDPNDKVVTRECLAQDEVLLSSLLSEKAKRVAETESLLNAIRSVSGEMKMSHDNVAFVLQAVVKAHTARHNSEDEAVEEQVRAVASLISESGGRIDVSTGGIQLLNDARDCFIEIYEGRSIALAFLSSTLQEASELVKSVFGGSQTPDESSSPPKPQSSSDMESSSLEVGVPKERCCHRDALLNGKLKLDVLAEPIETSIRALLYATNDDFLKYGIDSTEQRVSFFLGRQDSEQSASMRQVLVRYVSFAGQQVDSKTVEGFESRPDSLLSKRDPFYDEFCAVYSPSYVTHQLQRVKDAIAHVAIVQQTVESAQKRLKSLSTIMALYSELNQYRDKIREFEASASKKDRLFGNSLRLLEEERFRKTVAKRYPLRIAALKTEVRKWLHNDGGDYDLNILGQDMKAMLMDMMNTDTELMHLDLGVVGSSRQSARRGSKTTVTLAPALSSSSLSSVASDNSSASASAAVANSNQLQQQETSVARPMRTQSLSKLGPAAAKKRP